MNIFRPVIMKRKWLVLLAAMVLPVSLAVACGDAAPAPEPEIIIQKERVVETVIVEKQLPGETIVKTEKVIETVVVEKQVQVTVPGEKVTIIQTVVVPATARPAPTAAPTPEGAPKGAWKYAVSNVIPALFVPSKGGVGHEQDYNSWGMVEFIIHADHGTENYNYDESIVTSYEVNKDNSRIRFTVRKGIPFHKGWGSLTAHDIAWSFNSAIEEGSTFWGVGGLQRWIDRLEAVDDYTVDLYARTEIDPNWQFTFSNLSTHQPWVYPKAAVDALGEDRANVTPLGSGPFENVIYRTNDTVVVTAFNNGNHWRAKPASQQMTTVEIPEPLARNAAFRAGEVDIIEALNKDIPQLRDQVPGSYPQDARGTGWPHVVYFTGNYWAEGSCDADNVDTTWKKGAEFPRPGFLPDAAHPWIGDIFEGGGNSMESALKVRQAMSKAVNRPELLETVFGGLGLPTATYNGFLPADTKYWKDEWDFTYDLAAAKALLADAGYADGFEFTFYVPPDHIVVNPEAGQAIAQYWRNLGLTVNIEQSAYATARPRHFLGQDDIIWYHHSGTGNWDKPKGGAYGPSNTFHGAELPCDMQALHWDNRTNQDKDQRIANSAKMQDYISKWRMNMPFASITDYWMVGPRIAAWSPHKIAGRYFTNPETVQVKD